ncbi:MAG: RidA family protein [Dehalococcoidia bacterium]|nr:RidA family protein [Dehalococcoidia bacterium]
MDKKTQNFEFLKKAGPYSNAVEANGFLFFSGMLPYDENGTVVTGDISKATKLALGNIKRGLTSMGSHMDKVVKATVYLRDMADFAAMNEVYKTFFPTDPPSRTCIAVKDIPANAPLEIEIIALK